MNETAGQVALQLYFAQVHLYPNISWEMLQGFVSGRAVWRVDCPMTAPEPTPPP